MKILVTGSEGVIGQNLVPRLEALGHELYRFDIRRNDADDILDRYQLEKRVVWFHPDLIIHMAAAVGRYNSQENPDRAVDLNIKGTYHVIKACLKISGCNLINFSTSEVYGHNSEYGQPDPFEQNGVYGLTKLVGEALVKHYMDVDYLHACSIRPFMVYGPYEVPDGIFRSAISNFIDAAHNNKVLTVHEGAVRSWCYVDDFIDGLLLVIEKHDFSTREYLGIPVGTQDYRTMEECAKAVISIVGSGSYELTPTPSLLVSKVKRESFDYITQLGFTQRVSLNEGITRTYNWMKEEL